MQSTVDYESKKIVTVNITDKPTDPDQLKKQLKNIENKIEQTPIHTIKTISHMILKQKYSYTQKTKKTTIQKKHIK